MTAAETRMTRARTALVLDHPWFGALALRLRVEPDPAATSTMATNGTMLKYSPAWVEAQTDAELRGVYAHEVLHCALLHPYRMGSRDPRRWNEAADYAVNPLLVAAGFKLPAGSLIDRAYNGMSAEQIYSALQQAPAPEQPGAGYSQPRAGEVEAAPQPAAGSPDGTPETDGPHDYTAADWQIATEQASMVAKRAGHLPGDADRAARAGRQPVIDWRAVLREFVAAAVPTDYSWARPNRRYIAAGLYLPGIVREGTPRIAVAVDTSGSVSAAMLDTFASEITGIAQECRPESIDVIYHDARIQHHESFTADDMIELHPRGGGGTDFNPVLTEVRDSAEPYAAVLMFTDLDGPATIDPGIPVLWITPAHCNRRAPFGQIVRMT